MRILLFLSTLFLIHSEPISKKDKEIIIFYKCNIHGEYAFDSEGRAGLATISAIKKIEEENQKDHRGGVFLFSSGQFSEYKEKFRGLFELIALAGFDASFVSEKELQYLEENPNKKNLSLPILAHRENTNKYNLSKKFKSENLEFQVSHLLSDIEDKNLDFELVFPQFGNLDYLNSFSPEKPTYFFLESAKTSNFSFTKKNMYLIDCPKEQDLGKLTLYFRNKRLIRQKQNFISLNSNSHNKNWISPDRNIIKYLE